MKKIVWRFGLYAAFLLIVLFLLKFAILGNDNWALQEVLGWASMVLGLLFVFFGIKHYRDHVNQGVLSFGKGMKVGLLIILIPTVAFGIFDVVYIKLINPDFFDKYYSFYSTQMQQTLPQAEFESWKTKMEASKKMFQNPFVNFLVMSATIFIIGVIITVISSLILMRKPKVAIG